LSSLSYNDHIIREVNLVTHACGPVLLFGENIDTGSRIGGLARGLTVNPKGRIQNVGNCELVHCGLGLGMMLDGGQSALFVKQLDFMLLGIDQFVNTFNCIRAFKSRSEWGSFTIFTLVCDQGFQGPQSSFNGAGDFASIANIPVFCLNAAGDAAQVIRHQFAAPGFRIICLSQRLFGAPALELPLQRSTDDDSVFQYESGSDATVVSFNFSLRDAVEMTARFRSAGVHADLFHVNCVPGAELHSVLESCRRTRKLILIDDSKTVTKWGDVIVTQLSAERAGVDVISFCRRGCADGDYGATDDRFRPDVDTALDFVRIKSLR
jgi:pyruvate dehydrogenase E1 component beta subunit